VVHRGLKSQPGDERELRGVGGRAKAWCLLIHALQRLSRSLLNIFVVYWALSYAPEKGGSYNVWVDRPLPQALVDYAAADVAGPVGYYTPRHPAHSDSSLLVLRMASYDMV
jgi:hypothetical protein